MHIQHLQSRRLTWDSELELNPFARRTMRQIAFCLNNHKGKCVYVI